MCTQPLIAWKRKFASLTEPAKIYYINKKLKFHQPADWWNYEIVKISCGVCQECMLNHANGWATRIFMESKMHAENCFVTLTYAPDYLPTRNGKMTLKLKDMTDFIKRLRYHIGDDKISYFYCGEYGPKTHRPHYHLIIFGWKPADQKMIGLSKTLQNMYTSDTLADIWGKGHIAIEELNYRTACYTARYCLKKAGIKQEKRKYTGEIEKIKKIDERNGKEFIDYKQKIETNRFDYLGREKEFIRMSRAPAIGLNYWLKNKEKIKRNNGILIKIDDKVHIKPIPRYFKKLWERENQEEFIRANYKQKQNIDKQTQDIVSKISLGKKFISDDIEFENKEKKLNEIKGLNKEFKVKFLKRNQI